MQNSSDSNIVSSLEDTANATLNLSESNTDVTNVTFPVTCAREMLVHLMDEADEYTEPLMDENVDQIEDTNTDPLADFKPNCIVNINTDDENAVQSVFQETAKFENIVDGDDDLQIEVIARDDMPKPIATEIQVKVNDILTGKIPFAQNVKLTIFYSHDEFK